MGSMKLDTQIQFSVDHIIQLHICHTRGWMRITNRVTFLGTSFLRWCLQSALHSETHQDHNKPSMITTKIVMQTPLPETDIAPED